MCKRILLVAVLLILSFLASGAKAQAQPKIVVRATSDGVRITPGATVEMGSVPVSTLLTKTFRIYNEGTQTLVLSTPPITIFSSSAFFVYSPPATSILPPGFSTDFTIGFSSSVPTNLTVTIGVHSNDPLYPAGFTFQLHAKAVGPYVGVNVNGQPVLNNSLYTFPSTTPGAAVGVPFTITNGGNAPLTISNFTLSASGGFSVLIWPQTTPIDPGNTTNFRIRLLSNTPGTYTGTVTFNTNVADIPTYRIDLRGTVGAPEIRVVSGDGITLTSGSLYTMQSTTVAMPVSRAFTIYNDGIAPLHISNPASLVSGTGFSEIGTPPAAEIAPNSSTTFRVRLLSNSAGTYNGAITIQNDDPDENPFIIQLRGTVTP
jgi:hypothetical protein